jgi:hypothetical protein
MAFPQYSAPRSSLKSVKRCLAHRQGVPNPRRPRRSPSAAPCPPQACVRGSVHGPHVLKDVLVLLVSGSLKWLQASAYRPGEAMRVAIAMALGEALRAED